MPTESARLLHGDQILLYGDVGDAGDGVEGFSPADVAKALAARGSGDITVRLNSGGGSAFDGMAIYSMLKAYAGKVKVVVDGIAASAASLILMAGDRREIRDGAMVMIHDIAGMTFGDAAQHDKARSTLDALSNQYARIYAEATGLAAATARALMIAESWFDADEAVSRNFATGKVADPALATAAFDYRRYAHAPIALLRRLPPSQRPPAAAASTQGVAPMPKSVLQTVQEIEAAVPGRIQVLADRRDRLHEGITQAILARAGIERHDPKNEFNAITPMGIVRAVAEDTGIKAPRGDAMRLVAMVLTQSSSDFPQILSNIANKAMLKGYEETDETFESWTGIGSLPDFKSARAVDLNAVSSLPHVPENAEYRHLTAGERGEAYSLASAGGLFSISRQSIVNDDAEVFTKLPRKLGQAAKRSIGNDVYGLLTSPPIMGDNVPLFHPTHKNVATGAGSSISPSAIASADLAMGTQTDRSDPSVVLKIVPRTMILPRALRFSALQLVHSASQLDQPNPGVINPMRNLVENIVAEPRLDAASATSWYLAADPAIVDTISVIYLNGKREPTIEQFKAATSDGVTFKIRHDYGVKAFGWEGLYKAAGV